LYIPDRIELKPNQTILFIGDSITDAGRLEAAYRPFGYGYVHFVAYQLLAKYTEYNLSIINTGISGDTYQLTYKRLLLLVKEKYNCQLILMTWFILTCGRMHGLHNNGSKQQSYNRCSRRVHFKEDEKFFFFVDSVTARTKSEAEKIAPKNSNFTLYTLSK
jgi:hypothetical protein